MALSLFLVFADKDSLFVSLAGSEQVVDNPRQFVGSGSNGLRRSQSRTHSAVETAQMGAAASQRLSSNAQGVTCTAIGLACLGRKYLATTLLVGWTQRKPTCESCRAGKSAQIRSDFGQKGVCGESTDAGNGGEIGTAL